jgi:hypothetical protein
MASIAAALDGRKVRHRTVLRVQRDFQQIRRIKSLISLASAGRSRSRGWHRRQR